MATLHEFIFNFSGYNQSSYYQLPKYESLPGALFLLFTKWGGRKVKSSDGSLLQETVWTVDYVGGHSEIQNMRLNSMCRFCLFWKTLGSHWSIQGDSRQRMEWFSGSLPFYQSIFWISIHTCWGSRQSQARGREACPALPSPPLFCLLVKRTVWWEETKPKYCSALPS